MPWQFTLYALEVKKATVTDMENTLWEYKIKVVDLDVDSKNMRGFDYRDSQTGAAVDVRFAPLVVELPETLDLNQVSIACADQAIRLEVTGG